MSEPEAPLVAGRYRLVHIIGDGGFGRVWRARDEQGANREVAIKELWRVGRTEEGQREDALRAMREAKHAMRIHHPYVIETSDVFMTDDGRPWIVMELLDWPTLQEYVEQRDVLSVTRLAKLAEQLLEVLRALSEERMLHRDIKPSNILVGPKGEIKLIDFGIALRWNETRLTQKGLVIGSPGYMAPEYRNGRPATLASELWAVGAVLHFCLTKEPPSLPVPFSNLPQPLRRLLEGLLQENLMRRLTLAQAVTALYDFRTGRHSEPPALTAQPLAQPRTRNEQQPAPKTSWSFAELEVLAADWATPSTPKETPNGLFYDRQPKKGGSGWAFVVFILLIAAVAITPFAVSSWEKRSEKIPGKTVCITAEKEGFPDRSKSFQFKPLGKDRYVYTDDKLRLEVPSGWRISSQSTGKVMFGKGYNSECTLTAEPGGRTGESLERVVERFRRRQLDRESSIQPASYDKTGASWTTADGGYYSEVRVQRLGRQWYVYEMIVANAKSEGMQAVFYRFFRSARPR